MSDADPSSSFLTSIDKAAMVKEFAQDMEKLKSQALDEIRVTSEGVSFVAPPLPSVDLDSPPFVRDVK